MRLCIDDPRVDVRICNQHATETVNVLVKWYTKKGQEIIKQVEMNLPVSVNTDKPALSQDGIERSERIRRRSITSAEQSIRQGDIRTTLDLLSNLYQAPQGPKKLVLYG
jgi:hypothetical protein